jgi:hypothetical protein
MELRGDRLFDSHLPAWSTRQWQNVAFRLAIAAGVLTLAFSIWPIAILHGYTKIAVIWGMIGHIAGALYLGAAYLVRRRRPVASPLMSIAGLLLMFSGLGTGRLLALTSLEHWWLAIAFDLLPITVGILATGALTVTQQPQVRTPESIVVELPEGSELR